MEKFTLDFEAIAFVSDNIGFASAYEFNGLYKVDIASEECEFISIFPQEKLDGKRIHCTAKYIMGKVYFIPASGKFISIYNIEKNELIQIAVPECKQMPVFYKKRYRFINGVLNGENLWLVPSTYPGIVQLNLISNKMTIHDQWVPEEGYFFRNSLCVKNSTFYIANGNGNMVLAFNMENAQASIYHIGKNNAGIMSMCMEQNNMWMAPRLKGPIIRWNIESNEVKEYFLYLDAFTSDKIYFSKVFRCENRMYFIPAGGNHAVIVSLEDDTETMMDDEKWKIQKNSMIEYMFETEKKLFFREKSELQSANRYVKISKKDVSVSDYLFTVSETGSQKEHYRKKVDEGNTINENQVFNLYDFIDNIK